MEWRSVVGFEGLYEVSDFGEVVRINHCRTGERRLLKPIITKDGYRNVGLCREGVAKTFGIHCLVASAFIGPKCDGYEVNHKNGIKYDNRPSNLEYLTRSENCKHAYNILGRKRMFGEINHKARATSKDIADARSMLRRGVPKLEVAQRFCHHLSWAYRIANGDTRLRG